MGLTLTRWITRLLAVVAVIVCTSPVHAGLVFTGPWEKVDGFFGPAVGGDVLRIKEAFGAASTMDEEITGVDKMPGVGKTLAEIRRNADAATRVRVGAVFERPFTLTEDSLVEVRASTKGQFVAAGAFFDPLFDNAMARVVVTVLGTALQVHPEASTPDLSVAGPGNYAFLVPKSKQGELEAGDYILQFSFIRSINLRSGAGGATLAAESFGSDTADVAAVPEPSTLTMLGVAALGVYGATWRRRKGHRGPVPNE